VTGYFRPQCSSSRRQLEGTPRPLTPETVPGVRRMEEKEPGRHQATCLLAQLAAGSCRTSTGRCRPRAPRRARSWRWAAMPRRLCLGCQRASVARASPLRQTTLSEQRVTTATHPPAHAPFSCSDSVAYITTRFWPSTTVCQRRQRVPSGRGGGDERTRQTTALWLPGQRCGGSPATQAWLRQRGSAQTLCDGGQQACPAIRRFQVHGRTYTHSRGSLQPR
jgi:hypothetical protein